jgi:hypothetical protein
MGYEYEAKLTQDQIAAFSEFMQKQRGIKMVEEGDGRAFYSLDRGHVGAHIEMNVNSAGEAEVSIKVQGTGSELEQVSSELAEKFSARFPEAGLKTTHSEKEEPEQMADHPTRPLR